MWNGKLLAYLGAFALQSPIPWLAAHSASDGPMSWKYELQLQHQCFLHGLKDLWGSLDLWKKEWACCLILYRKIQGQFPGNCRSKKQWGKPKDQHHSFTQANKLLTTGDQAATDVDRCWPHVPLSVTGHHLSCCEETERWCQEQPGFSRGQRQTLGECRGHCHFSCASEWSENKAI